MTGAISKLFNATTNAYYSETTKSIHEMLAPLARVSPPASTLTLLCSATAGTFVTKACYSSFYLKDDRQTRIDLAIALLFGAASAECLRNVNISRLDRIFAAFTFPLAIALTSTMLAIRIAHIRDFNLTQPDIPVFNNFRFDQFLESTENQNTQGG